MTQSELLDEILLGPADEFECGARNFRFSTLLRLRCTSLRMNLRTGRSLNDLQKTKSYQVTSNWLLEVQASNRCIVSDGELILH